MGPQPLISEKAQKVGVTKTFPLAHLDEFVGKAASQGRKVHFLPPYRYHNMIQLHRLLGIPFDQMKSSASVEFIKGVVSLRLIKEECEVAEIEKACNSEIEGCRSHIHKAVYCHEDDETRNGRAGTCRYNGGDIHLRGAYAIIPNHPFAKW